MLELNRNKMTRINSAIDPRNLTDQHLIAELRELPRIFTAVKKRLEQGKEFNDIPKEFCLGSGHCKFFYDKLYFLNFRFQDLKIEYRKRYDRGWVPDQLSINETIKLANKFLFNNHQPTQKEMQLLMERISTRIKESNQIPRYYGRTITKLQAVHLLMYGQIGENLSCLDNNSFEVIVLKPLKKETWAH